MAKTRAKSQWEEVLSFQLRAARLPASEREHRFAAPRRWRFDFAWPDRMIAVEVEGITRWGKNRNGTMKLGRHQTAKGYEADAEKYNTAAMLGWRVLRVTQTHIKDGRALQWIEEMLGNHEI